MSIKGNQSVTMDTTLTTSATPVTSQTYLKFSSRISLCALPAICIFNTWNHSLVEVALIS